MSKKLMVLGFVALSLGAAACANSGTSAPAPEAAKPKPAEPTGESPAMPEVRKNEFLKDQAVLGMPTASPTPSSLPRGEPPHLVDMPFSPDPGAKPEPTAPPPATSTPTPTETPPAPVAGATRPAETTPTTTLTSTPDLKEAAPAARTELDVSLYAVHAAFDWGARKLVSEVEITFSPATGTRTLELDARVSLVRSVKSKGTGADLPFQLAKADRKLRIQLATDAEQTIVVGYEAAVDPTRAHSGVDDVRLRAYAPVDKDDVQSRVVYTNSEPRGAALWMPCHDVPTDRAIFEIDMSMPDGEKLVANGDLIHNEIGGDGLRHMLYRSRNPIPTYVMAFAQGELESEDAKLGDLPVSIWARRGMQAAGKADLKALLRETKAQIELFEKLLIPFPHEKYSVVFLPEMPGAEENVGITFALESYADPRASDISVMAHELGHQWFGDYMTVSTWDDLWIKEGMATLLANEAGRAQDDPHGKGLLFGDLLRVKSGEAVRDEQLPPEKKYTSGPYGRAAWVYGQVRALIGEEMFWGTLRTLLQSHPWGHVGTEDVLAAFEPALPSGTIARVRVALAAHPLPQLVATTAGGALRLTMEDKESALIAPLELSWIGSGGERAYSLESRASVTIETSGSGFLAIDPRDTHIDLDNLVRKNDPAAQSLLHPLLFPRSKPELAGFFKLGGTAQLAGLSHTPSLPVDPDHLDELISQLDSPRAQAAALNAACATARELRGSPADFEKWSQAIGKTRIAPPRGGTQTRWRMMSCTLINALD